MSAAFQHQDVIAQTAYEMMPIMVDNYSHVYPAVDMLFNGPNVKRAQAGEPYRKMSIWRGGPGKDTHIETGSETYGGTLTEIGKETFIFATRIVYSYEIPGKHVAEANASKEAGKQYHERYNVAAIEHICQLVEQALLIGNWTGGLQALGTFNGNVTGISSTGGMENGLFHAALPAAQTTTVLGYPKAGAAVGAIDVWHNWYPTAGKITSWASHGYKRTKSVYNKVARRAKTAPITMISDEASFENYEENLVGVRRFVSNGGGGSKDTLAGEAGADVLEGLAFGTRGRWFPSEILDTSAKKIDGVANAFTNAGEGIIYGMVPDHFYGFTLRADEGPKASTTMKWGIAVREPTKVNGKDAYEYELILHIGWYLDRMNVNFVVDGSANP